MCHKGTVKEQKKHNKFCYDCASGADATALCPIHLEKPFMNPSEINLEPTLEEPKKEEKFEQLKGVSTLQ